MIEAARTSIQAITRFLRTPSLSRSVVALVSLAIILLLAVNIATFVMIRRTADFNDRAERSQESRRAARTVLLTLLDAETGQRGFLLTGRTNFLQPYTNAQAMLPEQIEELKAAVGDDEDLQSRVVGLEAVARQKLDELSRTIDLGRTGRFEPAVQEVRGGRGKVLMDELRRQVAAIDEIEEGRLSAATRQSEWAAIATALVNALAGALILVLAVIVLWLVRRYVEDIERARLELDRLNAGLEDEVRSRTGALVRANEEIQRFAYIVSHDLRAPLVNVMGYTAELEQAGRALDRQIVRLEAENPALIEQDAVIAVREDVPEAIGFIRASTAKMDRLINAILKLSREGRRNLTPEPLDMTAMAQGIADSLNHQTEAAGAEIRVETLPGFDSDRLSVEQVFGNLIDNAVKYLDPDRAGLIVVSGEAVSDIEVEYRIVDNGRGVSDRDHERIFELFRRSGRQDRPGEGLGLAFVRNSVRRLGGEITVESELGKGSTFLLKFPKRLVLSEAGDSV